MKVAVLDDYGFIAKKMSVWDKLNSKFSVDFFDKKVPIEKLRPYHALVAIRERTVFTAEMLLEMDNLSMMALTGRVGSQIDLEFAKNKNIDVSYTKGSMHGPIELTLGLLLALNKDLLRHNANVQKGLWHTSLTCELRGKTIGIVGLGRLGQQVALICKALGMKVISTGKKKNHPFAEMNKIERTSLKDLFHRSYAVSLHLRLNDETKGMIGYRELELLKPGSILINTARSQLIRMQDLIKIARQQKVKFGLDVFDIEPISDECKDLLGMDNVLLSPHMGYMSEETYSNFFNQVVDNLNNWLHGKPYLSAFPL